MRDNWRMANAEINNESNRSSQESQPPTVDSLIERVLSQSDDGGIQEDMEVDD